jgi:hypothetical protein
MKTVAFLTLHSRRICMGLALVVAAIISIHIAMDSVIPIADGEGYAIRAFALYGDLHTGQWGPFWRLLVRPSQSILPPHDLLFFLLPGSLAGTASYAALQNITTYLMLAYAIAKSAQVLGRPAWAPVIFLLVSVNNIALIDFYAFYVDMTFMAAGFLVIALQMNAWKENRALISFLSGLALGLLFFVKPANALIFLTTYLLSELFFAIGVPRSETSPRGFRLGNLWRQGGYRLLGFFPVLFLVSVCGGAQTILQLIDQNEIHYQAIPIACGGLLRLLYFPLYLAVCYHVLLLGGLLLAAMVFYQWRPDKKVSEAEPAFPMQYLLPVALSYLILGEFFSFWMEVKPVRAVLLILPVLGFVFCWWWERRRLPIETLMAVAVVYACAAFSQKAFNVLGTRDHLAEENYQLTGSSWLEMPSPWHQGGSLNQAICHSIGEDVPAAGIICVNAIEIRNGLMWRLNNGPILLGKPAPYDVRNLFNFKGEYYEQSLNGANMVALITFQPVQSSRAAWLQSMGILSYGNDEWVGKGLARASELPSVQGQAMGTKFIFDHPLTQADVDRANQSAAFAGAAKNRSDVPDPFFGRHYSRAEAWQLLETWFNKRFN